ncbi:MAG: XdhC family protein [Candidatus Rokubacteria bacterium]|nr:XdhC family protein [Candidatus Rokubacteria bacterium]
MTADPLALAQALREQREAFALALVVRVEPPTSAKPGAKALIRADGSVTGWIGGACAEPTVVREALAALRDGRPRFLSLVGEGGPRRGRTEGVVEYPMTCHSGGTLEIYVEPYLPKPELVLVGHGPVLDTLATLGRAADFEVITVDPSALDELAGRRLAPRACVVVATHGADDEDALEIALRGRAGYVSFVASRKRAAAVVESLRRRGVPAERLGSLKAPAGLDLGAVTPAEIAVSILAEIVHVGRSWKPPAADGTDREGSRGGTEAIDPICGMTVDTTSARHRSETPGGTVFFCCPRCKETFDRQSAR